MGFYKRMAGYFFIFVLVYLFIKPYFFPEVESTIFLIISGLIIVFIVGPILYFLFPDRGPRTS